jgi:UDP-N-acetylmuramate dehydrogenase
MINIIEKDLTTLATIRTQSKTRYFVQVNSIIELNDTVSYARKNNLNLVVIGNGTNVLFSKKNYVDKIFVKLGKKFNFFKIYNDIVEIGGASSFISSGKKLISMGYENFVYMTLIPGSLGGSIRQNAGTTNEGEVKDNFISAIVYDLKENKSVVFDKKKMDFKYRHSVLQNESNRYIVLSAKFYLGNKTNDIKSLKQFVKEKQKLKKEKEPKGFSFGSTFKSIKYPKQVWWYIEQVGLRNKSIGGAKFSEKHSNWIINFDNAKSDDIINLIEEAKEKVKKEFDINLETEVELI